MARLNWETTTPTTSSSSDPSFAAEQNTSAMNLPSPPPSSGDISPGIVITVLVLAVAVILSASIYLLLRFFRRRNSNSNSNSAPNTNANTNTIANSISTRVISNSKEHNDDEKKNPLIESLPLFTFDSLTGRHGDGDCAVCLSKFEPKDLLRLLPLCCHAFHADCIDTWLSSHLSCPLCRSPLDHPLRHSTGGSFRVEIGNVSRRREPTTAHSGRRSFSISGSFDYILPDDSSSEIPAGSVRRVSSSEFKVEPPEQLAAEVGPRATSTSWLKDYLSLSSSSSFRGSSRWFFTGSSRRSTDQFDLEEGSHSHFGEEIGELFRWLSGV